MIDGNYFGLASREEVNEALAKLQIAAWMKLIPEPGLEAVNGRRERKNKEIEETLARGGIIYGPTCYTPAMYLQYELACFQLEFTVYKGKSVGGYVYKEIAEEEKRTFYEENRDLFTRYHGDSFAYEEVSMIIEKRIREQEYKSLVGKLSERFSSAETVSVSDKI